MTYNVRHTAVYSLNIHLVLVTKYRRKVINQSMLLRLQEIFENTCTLNLF
ncbi:transposase [Nostoc sp. CHAB 5784]|nr:transposase [Nostoc mirabile CHAB5784]